MTFFIYSNIFSSCAYILLLIHYLLIFINFILYLKKKIKNFHFIEHVLFFVLDVFKMFYIACIYASTEKNINLNLLIKFLNI